MPEDRDDIKSLQGADYLKKFHGGYWHASRGRASREVVFGANDGLVTTMASVAGGHRLHGGCPPHSACQPGGGFAGAVSMFFMGGGEDANNEDEMEQERVVVSAIGSTAAGTGYLPVMPASRLVG